MSNERANEDVAAALDDVWRTFDEVRGDVPHLSRRAVANSLRSLVKLGRADSRRSDAHGRVEYASTAPEWHHESADFSHR